MPIQRQDIVLIVLGICLGVIGMLCVALQWWAVLVGVVCGAGGGTVASIVIRIIRPRKTQPPAAVI
jgi:hypothetical protein